MTRDAIEHLVSEGHLDEARRAIVRFVETNPTHGNAAFAGRCIDRLGDALEPVNVAVLRSVTLEPMVPYVRAMGIAEQFDLRVSLGEYNQFEQEIFSAGPLCGTAPDVVVLLARLEELAPQLLARFAAADADKKAAALCEVTERMRSWISALRDRFAHAQILLHGMEQPASPALGLADVRVEGGQREFVRALNDRLGVLCREHTGTYYVDVDSCIAEIGRRAAYDVKLMAHARLPYSVAGQLAIARLWVRMIAAARRPRKKCVVLDGDNTLWGGILGEEGFDGVRLGPDFPGNAFVKFQQDLLALNDRGVVLAMNSKNNEADVLELIDNHPFQQIRREHLAAYRINWQDKAANLEELADEMNIGLDSIVFVDDSEFECQLVKQRLPAVQVEKTPQDPLQLIHFVHTLTCFDVLDVTAEDRTRGDMYRTQAARSRERQHHASLEEYLASLGMQVEIAFTQRPQVARVAQLTQRTNQFNLTTHRYDEAEIERLIHHGDCIVAHLRLQDRFGDYGITGAAIAFVEKQSLHIDTFLMSCRIIGRGVEDALLAFLCQLARQRGHDRIVGFYRPSAKNQQTATFYERLGFAMISENQTPPQSDRSVRYERDAQAPPIDLPEWLDITQPEKS